MIIKMLSSTLCGIKNIQKPITIDFYRKKSLKDFDSINDRVRVIYGPNGSGKTALMTGFFIAQKLLSDKDFFSTYGESFFENELNHKTKRMDFSTDFATVDVDEDGRENIAQIFSYEFTIQKYLNAFSITHEAFFQFQGKSRNTKKRTVFETVNGEIITFSSQKENRDYGTIVRQSTNTIMKQSFLVFLTNYLISLSQESYDGFQIDDAFKGLIAFRNHFRVLLNAEDIHVEYFKSGNDNGIEYEKMKSNPVFSPYHYHYVVSKKEIGEFRKFVDKQTEFIRIFKPNLKNIVLDTVETENCYLCREILDYGEDIEISRDFESAGIKKLMNLFPYLSSCSDGDMVFIDEMDANLTGVYLKRFIEYMNQFGEGQLCFTAHSLDPMYSLKDSSKAIYFMNENNDICAWTKNANYKPYILYPEGMIPGITFDLEPFDFLSVFDQNRKKHVDNEDKKTNGMD